MPKVYNKHHKDAPADAIYVGRPTRWGNPFEIGRDGTREEVIEKYRFHLIQVMTELGTEMLDQLKGKDLVCWCAPKACHADLLLELANATKD